MEWRFIDREYDMACPKCDHPLKVEGTKLVCSANCGYEREFIKPVLSQDQLLKRVAELEALLRKHRIDF